MTSIILLRHNLIAIPAASAAGKRVDDQMVGTIVSNLASYGYVLSKGAYEAVAKASEGNLKAWWQALEPDLREVSGASKRMDEHVVYKNFPKEVLDMTQAQYWVRQILMYWGVPNELVTEEAAPRASLFETLQLKVLQPAALSSLKTIFASLLKLPSRWTKDQLAWAVYIHQSESPEWAVTDVAFKENMALIVGELISAGIQVKVKSATDVLRLAMGLSGGDVSFREPSQFKSFSKSQRRYFLGLLESATDLAGDVARDPERWKRFLKGLHPNQYRAGRRKVKAVYPTVCQVYHQLYNGKTRSFNADIERLLIAEDAKVFELLKQRPGEFVRRLTQTTRTFGRPAVDQFAKIVPDLKVIQLLKLDRYLATINQRRFRTIAPKGNWTKLQVQDNKTRWPKTWVTSLREEIRSTLFRKVTKVLGRSVNLSPSADLVKLQTNDSDLSPLGRGTVFPIPDNVAFLRTASYWRLKTGGHCWFDNGWNFFDADWKAKGTLCWSRTDMQGAAVFSGDPTNCKDPEGRACQMIDLYIDKLAAKGIRYGVWNILCFSGIKFKDAEVFGAFQWGQDAGSGKLFEPARAQFAFPIAGDSLTKYILMLDVKERKLVYLDANLRSSTSSASANEGTLEKLMPAFVEYLDTLPSVYDLFKAARKASVSGIPISYDDSQLSLKGESAYVFKQVNKANSFKQLDLSPLLTA